MKYIFSLAILSSLLFGCADKQKQEKDLLNEVIATHDSVMAKDGRLMKNRMQMDTLLAAKPDPNGTKLRDSLNAVDNRMENWMHNFDAENKGKSHDEIMTYLGGQQREIRAIDQQFNSVLKSSDTYLKSAKTK